ncbi:MAG: hypothetical protein JW987_00615 [Anaerolineaceae bacterium]|nr:hypothetical protein [Anaerolineaceae bacterium]
MVKTIAGESGECFINTEQLAELCMMSEGKIADCRKYWLSTRLLTGKLEKVDNSPEGYKVWHLTDPDVWDQNNRWGTEYSTLQSRVDLKRDQRLNGNGWKSENQRMCPRCGEMFTITGPQSVRCENCSRAHNIEKNQVWRKLGTKTVNVPGASCTIVGCENTNLEYHLPSPKEEPVILCVDHHNELHRLEAENDRAAYDMNRSENPPSGLTHESSGLSHESSGLSGESSGLSRVVKEYPFKNIQEENPGRMAAPGSILELFYRQSSSGEADNFHEVSNRWRMVMAEAGVRIEDIQTPMMVYPKNGSLPSYQWPDDDWISISHDWDLNVFKDDNVLRMAIYPVVGGQTKTEKAAWSYPEQQSHLTPTHRSI